MSTFPDAAGFSRARLDRLDTLLQGYVDRGDLAGISAVVGRRGHTGYHARFGWADREAARPVRDDTLFTIASLTKPVTSVAIMTLYEEGHFHLNTPIAQFIPAFKDSRVCIGATEGGLILEPLERDITFRHLFTHTAGLSYGRNADDPVDRAYQAGQRRAEAEGQVTTNASLAQALAGLPLAFQPGTKWRYSLSIDVLGALVEVISGQPLDVFMQERLFEPLGMRDTAFFVPPQKRERLAVVYGHPEPGGELRRLDDIRPPAERPSWISGGGGLTSTLGDYARVAAMLANGGELDGVRILGPKTVALYSLNHTPAAALPYGFRDNDLYHAGYGYSLGTRVLMDVSQSGLYGSVGEFGWDGAFSTYCWVDPVESLYGVLMTQHSPNAYYPIHQQFKQLTYQALLG